MHTWTVHVPPVWFTRNERIFAVKRARQGFTATWRGHSIVIGRGKTISEDHPLVEEYPDMFADYIPDIKIPHDLPWRVADTRDTADLTEEETAQVVEPTEQATAAPGELRAVELPPVNPDDMSLAELKKIARKLGVRDYGSKSDIAFAINRKRARMI